MQTTSRTLDSGWRFKEYGSRGGSEASDLDWMPAQVPGHVHLDLVRNGVIEDPYYRLAERGCAWVDEVDWAYETTFTVDEPPAHAYLRFNGLDTIAEILLNGEEIGRTDNMFIAHEFPVGGKLREGENTLTVMFLSALRVGRERQKAWMEAGNESLPNPHWSVWGPRAFVRKAQYMYGWDWGPELVSCGIWRSVELITVPVARILDWRYDVEFTDDDRAIVTVEAEIERARGQEESDIELAVVLNGQSSGSRDDMVGRAAVPRGRELATCTVNTVIHSPAKWWPNGSTPRGSTESQGYSYRISLSLLGRDVMYFHAGGQVGLRTVDLVRESDGAAEGFRFRINGHDIFAKGANWIPAHSFPNDSLTLSWDNERDASSVDTQLVAAHNAGFNMLRVWGGGLYESEEFYNLCDSLGILVWQDFPYACSYYPDTGEYAEAARKEAVAAVRRIRNHPCLALWCGNNENNMMWDQQWQGKENRPPRFVGEKLYHEVLPAIVAEEDPKTPYWPSSPFGGEPANSSNAGDTHNWDVWHGRGDWKNYTGDNSRFLSEFGFSASCGLNAWERCLDESDKWPRSPAVRWHDKTRKGYETYLGYIQLHFPEPQTLEDLVYYSQLNQLEALKFGIEHWRRRKGHCWGTLFWQLNDCWPVQSWSVIDSEIEPKAAYFGAKRFYAPVLVSLVREDDSVHAHVTSDLLEDLTGEVTICVESFEGDVLASVTESIFLPANGTDQVASIGVAPFKAHERDVYVYVHFAPYTEIAQERIENLLFFAEPKDLRLADPGLMWSIEDDGPARWKLTFTTRRLAAYLWWRLDGIITPFETDDFFHLRAGQTRSVILPESDLLPTADTVRSLLRVRTL